MNLYQFPLPTISACLRDLPQRSTSTRSIRWTPTRGRSRNAWGSLRTGPASETLLPGNLAPAPTIPEPECVGQTLVSPSLYAPSQPTPAWPPTPPSLTWRDTSVLDIKRHVAPPCLDLVTCPRPCRLASTVRAMVCTVTHTRLWRRLSMTILTMLVTMMIQNIIVKCGRILSGNWLSPSKTSEINQISVDTKQENKTRW